MTIARRLIILVAIPILVLMGLGIFNRVGLAGIEKRSRFVAETQVGSLAALGNISRSFAELRVNVRSHLLSSDKAEQAKSLAAFQAGKADFTQLLREYEDTLISDEKDRRLLNEYRDLSDQYIVGAEKVMSLADTGGRDEALTMLFGPLAELSVRLGKVSSEWIRHNEQLATAAGRDAIASIEAMRRRMLVAVGLALAFSGVLGWLTFRRIVNPIRALQTSVESIAHGDYAQQVPFTKASDETGALARSVDVLKQGAAAMDEQRWVKANAAKLTGELQGAASLTEFGQRFVSGLVPVLGGGVAGFYLAEEKSETPPADRELRPDGRGRLRGFVPVGGGTGRSVCPRAKGPHVGEPAPRLSPDFVRAGRRRTGHCGGLANRISEHVAGCFRNRLLQGLERE